MRTTTAKHEWETGKGIAVATLTATAGVEITETDNFCDGHNTPTQKAEIVDNFEIIVKVAGMTFKNRSLSRAKMSLPQGMVAILGDASGPQMGLKEETFVALETKASAIVADVKQDADYILAKKEEAQTRQEIAEFEKVTSGIRKAMN